MDHILSIITWLPLLVGFVLLAIPEANRGIHGKLALGATIVTFGISLTLLGHFDPLISPMAPGAVGVAHDQFKFVESAKWIPQFGINYILGVDGIGLLMVLMTTAIFPFAVGASLKGIQDRTKMFYFLILLVETAILGVFDSLNLILFYVFYEAMLIPLYFLVGMWGGPKRVYATMKFFLYTMVGSMLMLVSILAIYFLVGTFDYTTVENALPEALSNIAMHSGHNHAANIEMLLFLGFFAAFAVKSPIFPFHSWVPDAYSESNTGTTVILVALKMGLYGFIRFNIALFPNATAQAAPVIVTFAVIGVIYAALIAAVQTDIKKLVAYSSISHVGVIVLAIFGLTAAGVSGAVIQMVSHTFTTGALFILVGYLYSRRGSYEISAYGGVWKVMPFFAVIFLIATLSAIALPGTAGFSGEFLMLIGTFQTHPWATGIATTSAVWSAVYMLWMFKRVMHGKLGSEEVAKLPDLTINEKWAMVPLVAVILWIGVYPIALLNLLNGPISVASASTLALHTAPTAETGSVVAILGRTWVEDHAGTRDLNYLPNVIDPDLPSKATALTVSAK